MENLNILIIEDNEEVIEDLVSTLENYNYNIIDVARNYKDALISYYKNSIDIVIIDIFLGDNPEGIAFAETISTVPNSLKPFLFLTSSKDRDIFERAKLTNPFRYLLKPFNEFELIYAIEMAIEKFYGQLNVFASKEEDTIIAHTYLFIKKKSILKKVKLSDIIYIEVENRYCNIITNKEKFVIQISLSKVHEYLIQDFFRQVHRKHIVNTNRIEEISLSKNTLLLQNNHLISFSDSYRTTIKELAILK